MANISATEIECQLLAEFLPQLHKSVDERQAFNSIQDPKELAIHVAINYDKWIKTHLSDTTNEVFCMVLNFVTAMNLYWMFCVAVLCGNTVMIEWVYNEILDFSTFLEKCIIMKSS